MTRAEYLSLSGALPPRRRRALWRTVYAALSPCQQRALLGHVVEGKSYAQLARELGVHRSTVLRNARRGMARLRRALED